MLINPGARLIPRALLHRELVRRAIALRLPLRNAGEGEPVLRAGGDPIRVEELLLDLAEAVPRGLFGEILRLIAQLRPPPAPA